MADFLLRLGRSVQFLQLPDSEEIRYISYLIDKEIPYSPLRRRPFRLKLSCTIKMGSERISQQGQLLNFHYASPHLQTACCDVLVGSSSPITCHGRKRPWICGDAHCRRP